MINDKQCGKNIQHYKQGGETLGGNKFKTFSKPFQGLSSDCSITIPAAFYQVMFLAII